MHPLRAGAPAGARAAPRPAPGAAAALPLPGAAKRAARAMPLRAHRRTLIARARPARVRVSGLKLPAAATRLLGADGYEELYPPQAAAVKAGLLGGRSVLVSAPTASGKTLIAALSMMAHLSAKRPGKIVYLSPLRALASEKFAEFKKIGGIPLGRRRARVKISTGETGAGARLGDADIAVMTNERMDSLMRQDPEWAAGIGLAVVDEIHLIGDPVRGPALEMILTRLRALPPASQPQIVGLSATMTNAAEVAKWLGARLVDSDWRPVSLREGVHHGTSIAMRDGEVRRLKPSGLGTPVDIGVEAVLEGGQALLFAESRARSVSLAEKAAGPVSKMLGAPDAGHLARAADRIVASGGGTRLAGALASLVRKGVAFHHAGLAQAARSEVEAAFRARRIRLLASTPTLAAGVNLPARRVVVSSILRYDPSLGRKTPISVLEYKQLCGRAGRPQYDEYGEAIVVSPKSYPKGDVMRRYVRGRPQPVKSQIMGERAVRAHALSLVVASPGTTESGAAAFFARTLAGRQATGRQATGRTVRARVASAIEFLAESGMVTREGARLSPTRLGSAASRLYLDPAAAASFRDDIEAAPERGGGGEAAPPGRRSRPTPARLTLGLLHSITTSDAFFPKTYMRRNDHTAAYRLFGARRREMIGYAWPSDCNRSLLALDRWIGEASEADIAGQLEVEAGDMHRIVESAEWLARCMGQLARELGRPDLAREIAVLRTRIRYGVGEELVELVSVRDIGRVRARRLYRRGITSKAKLSSVPERKLAAIDGIGPALAARLKSRVSAAGGGRRPASRRGR